MSADNWTTCPRCWDNAQEQNRAEAERVQALYGTVPVEEFDAAREALDPAQEADFSTFREDYEFYNASEGTVKGSYKGRCTVCGLSTEIKVEKRFWPDA